MMFFTITNKYKTEEISTHTLDEAFMVLAPFINSFFDCITITTENDISFKLNKKKSWSIVEQSPTFKRFRMWFLKWRKRD
jgi:hypothetical protein